MTFKSVYMDYNATTPLHSEVKKAINDAMSDFGNPSSVHEYGRRARFIIEQARHDIASFIGAEDKEIIFVGSGSEANNTVLNNALCHSSHCQINRKGRNEIVTTRIEHPSVIETSKCLNDRGTRVSYIDVDTCGKIDFEQCKDLVTENTAIVSVMVANNEIGTIQDIKAIALITHAKGAYFHTDAVQAVGKIPINVVDLDVDFLSFSAHKIYGPKGVGALYIKGGVPFCPLIRGGHQEQGRRAGTENTLGIIGMGKALEIRKREMGSEAKRLKKLIGLLKKGIQKNIPDVQFHGHPDDCLPGTLNVSIADTIGEAVVMYLDEEGVSVSTGSACSSESLEPSHVLLASGVSKDMARGSIRFSLGRSNTEKDVEFAVEKLRKVLKKLERPVN